MNGDIQDTYISTNAATKRYNTTASTLARWLKKGKIKGRKNEDTGKYLYCKSSLDSIFTKDINTPQKIEKKYICYARISSHKQKDDLQRQVEFLRSKYPNHDVVWDVGSGINYERKKFKAILESSMQGELKELVVAHRDRLCRFGFDIIKFILEFNKTKFIVINNGVAKQGTDELTEDLSSIIHVYTMRQLGRRRYSDKSSQSSNISNTSTEKDIS